MPDETSPLVRPQEEANNSSDVEDDTAIVNEQPEETKIEVSGKSYLAFVIPMSIGIFLSAMDGTIIVSSYEAIGSELNQLQSTSWIATAYMLTTTSFQPLYGKLSDIFGCKSCLLFAYTIFAIGCLGCGLARNMTELIAARAFTGVGGGGMSTIVVIVMSDVIPLRSRGTWQGIMNIVWTVGSASGAPLGGFLADSIGWRWAFLMQVPIAILAFIAVSLALHLPKVDNSDVYAKLKRIDFAGSLALILTIFTLLVGLDSGGNISWSDPKTLIALGSSLTCFLLFGVIETRLATEPIAPKRIIFNQSLIAGYLVNFFEVAAAMSLTFHVSLYLQVVQGKTASAAGLWLVLGVAGGMIGSLTGGLTIQATGRFYLITVGSYALQFLGTSVVGLSTGILMHSVIFLGAGLFVSTLGNGSGVTMSLIALIANAGKADQAIATAVSYLFRSLGAVVGISVGSTIVQGALQTYLRKHLAGMDVEEIILRVRESLSYIEQLDPTTRIIVRDGYAQAVQVTLAFSVAMSACSFISSAFIKEKALAQ